MNDLRPVQLVAVDPLDQDDVIAAAELTEDINELVEDGEIEIRINDKGEPTLWPAP